MLLAAIERHLSRSGMPPTRFGREAVGDPRFVLDLRNGREPRPTTCDRVLAYLAARSGEGWSGEGWIDEGCH